MATAPALASTLSAVHEVIVVTVRHPDYENETTVFGADKVRLIDLDLGRSFDARHAGPREYDTLVGWAASHWQEVSDLDEHDPACAHVQRQLLNVLRDAGRYETSPNADGSWDVYDWAESTAVATGLSREQADAQVAALENDRDLHNEIRLEIARSCS